MLNAIIQIKETMTPICETQYSFKPVDELGHPFGVYITVVSSRAKNVTNVIRDVVNQIKRSSEFKVKLGIETDVQDDTLLEIKTSVSRIVSWSGFEEECNDETKLLLCSTNPIIRTQIIAQSNRLGEYLDSCVEQLLEYAKNELKLSKTQKDGATLRDHLEAIFKQTGVRPKELTVVDVPNSIMYLWEWFLELNSTRQSGFGASAISYTEMKSWCEMTGNSLSPYETKVIKMLDRTFLEHYNEQSKGDK